MANPPAMAETQPPVCLQSDVWRGCRSPASLIRAIGLFSVAPEIRSDASTRQCAEQASALCDMQLLAAFPHRSAAEERLLSAIPGLLFPRGLPMLQRSSTCDSAGHASSSTSSMRSLPIRRFTGLLTDSMQVRVHVAAVVQYVAGGEVLEPLEDTRSNSQAGGDKHLQKRTENLAPLAICMLSESADALSPALLQGLSVLLNVIASAGGLHSAEAIMAAAEQFAQLCAWLVLEVPAPPPGTALVLHDMLRTEGTSEIRRTAVPDVPATVSRPLRAGLPHAHVSLHFLLGRLGVGELVMLLRLLLLEKQVVLRSSSATILVACCEALTQILLFPLAWQHPCIPLSPQASQANLLARRGPWLLGVQREVLELGSGALTGLGLPGRVDEDGQPRLYSIFDLDVGEVDYAPDVEQLPRFPADVESRLRNGFTELRAWMHASHDVVGTRSPELDMSKTGRSGVANRQAADSGASLWTAPSWWPARFGSELNAGFNLELQRIVFQSVAEVLFADIRSFLGMDAEALFDVFAFIESRPQEAKAFCRALADTDAFQEHLESLRLYSPGTSPFEEALRADGLSCQSESETVPLDAAPQAPAMSEPAEPLATQSLAALSRAVPTQDAQRDSQAAVASLRVPLERAVRLTDCCGGSTGANGVNVEPHPVSWRPSTASFAAVPTPLHSAAVGERQDGDADLSGGCTAPAGLASSSWQEELTSAAVVLQRSLPPESVRLRPQLELHLLFGGRASERRSEGSPAANHGCSQLASGLESLPGARILAVARRTTVSSDRLRTDDEPQAVEPTCSGLIPLFAAALEKQAKRRSGIGNAAALGWAASLFQQLEGRSAQTLWLPNAAGTLLLASLGSRAGTNAEQLLRIYLSLRDCPSFLPSGRLLALLEAVPRSRARDVILGTDKRDVATSEPDAGDSQAKSAGGDSGRATGILTEGAGVDSNERSNIPDDSLSPSQRLALQLLAYASVRSDAVSSSQLGGGESPTRRIWPPRGYRHRVPKCFLPGVANIAAPSRQASIEVDGDAVAESAEDGSYRSASSRASDTSSTGCASGSVSAAGAVPANGLEGRSNSGLLEAHLQEPWHDTAEESLSDPASPTVLNRLRRCLRAPRDPCAASAELVRVAYSALQARQRRDATWAEQQDGSFARIGNVRNVAREAAMVFSDMFDDLRSSLQSTSYRSPTTSLQSEDALKDILGEMRGRFCELQACDPRELDHEQRLAFWLNVMNASMLAWLSITDRKPGQRGQWVPLKSWIRFTQKSYVDVGGHELSLFEMEHLMLRAGSQPPVGRLAWFFIQALQEARHERAARRERRAGCTLSEMALQSAAPEVSFGISYPIKAGCPPLRVYKPEAVKPQLLLNCAHYIWSSLQVDVSRRRAWLPVLFKHYSRDFGASTAELLEFARATLMAVPGALEGVERLTGCRGSRADISLAAESRQIAGELEALRDPAWEGSFARASGDSAAEVSTSFSGASLRAMDFDWAFDFAGRAAVCPELEGLDNAPANATAEAAAAAAAAGVLPPCRRLDKVFDASPGGREHHAWLPAEAEMRYQRKF